MQIKSAPIKLESKGYFGLAVFKEDGTEVIEKRREDTENVVTYSGAYSLFFKDSNHSLVSKMKSQVGTGSTELTRNSSGLTSLLATTLNDSAASRASSEVSNSDGTATHTAVRANAFPLGGVVGTISEVGLITDVSSDFIAGQLIKDEFGSPTTLTLLSDEQLIVTYTIISTFPDGSGGFGPAAPLVGSGTVTTPTGNSSYNMYAQPLFNEYNGTFVVIRTTAADTGYILSDTLGAPTYGLGNGSDVIKTHDGSGKVTIDFTSKIAAPADHQSTDIHFISAGSVAANSYYSQIDPATKLSASTDEVDSSSCLVVEFEPSLQKTSSDSMTVHMTMEYQV